MHDFASMEFILSDGLKWAQWTSGKRGEKQKELETVTDNLSVAKLLTSDILQT